MVVRTITQLLDDLDHGPAAETVEFGLDGVLYEIDLNEEHARQLREALEPWISAGRQVKRQTRSGRPRSGQASDAAAIRQWAQESGIEVSQRGRIPAELRERYLAAQSR